MKNLKLLRTTPSHPDFQKLIALLDAELSINNGDEDAFFSSHNTTDTVKHAIVAYYDDIPAGTGAIKPYSENQIEVKRMYVPLEFRGKGIASAVVTELENWARELGFPEAILETGVKQVEAVSLYPKLGYQITAKYPPYENSEMSVCMKKSL
ncbi:MAG: GNAT family N-acetyltransferase [Flavobacterium sp.]|nr:MAG: GNAT family N-acetyltransferase [Flavobacterium sp.]